MHRVSTTIGPTRATAKCSCGWKLVRPHLSTVEAAAKEHKGKQKGLLG